MSILKLESNLLGMVDRKARNKLAEQIRHLVAGLITNDDFEQEVLEVETDDKGYWDTGAYFDDIEYAFFMDGGASLTVYESGNYRGNFGPYAASDRQRVAVEGGVVKYYRNGVLLYTSTVAPQYPLLVDTSLNTVWSYLANVVISTVPAPNPVRYVLQDIQGSTRVVMSGSAIVARHDYLPFGEEIGVLTGMRTTAQGFGSVDKIRQRYGLMERDDSSGLDHTQWRKYENTAGRWTSPDPYGGSMTIANPQSFNRYAYVQNDPVNFVDPSGLLLEDPAGMSRPQPLPSGPGFMSPGIHTFTYYTQTSSLIDGVRQFYPERGPYYGTFVVGGGGGSGGAEFLPNGGSYGEGGEKLIRSVLDSLLQNERCRRAFEILGLQTINQTVENGLGIGPATLLNNPRNNAMSGIVEGARRAYNDQFGDGAQAGTIMKIPGQPNPFASTRDQRPRMFFATSAFNDGASGLRWNMVHEFIHAGGQTPIPGWFGGLRHDLAGYEWHDFLQDSCK